MTRAGASRRYADTIGGVDKEALAAACRSFALTRTVTFADFDPVPRYVWARMGALASDVTSAVELLAENYDAAQEAVRDVRRLMRTPETAGREVFDRSDVPIRRVITAFKLVYIFVRAYQDAVCGALYELSGQKAGKYTSMGDALKKPHNPVRKLLVARLPGYVEWFGPWKQMRDTMKTGANFMLGWDGEDNLSVTFTYPVGDNAMGMADEQISLTQIVEGLEMSARLTHLVYDLMPGSPLVLRFDLTA